MRRYIFGWKSGAVAVMMFMIMFISNVIHYEMTHRELNERITILELSVASLLSNYKNYKSMHLQRVDFENIAMEDLYFRMKECEIMAESALTIADSTYIGKYDWIEGLTTTQADSVYLNVPEEQWAKVAQELKESSPYQ